MPPPRRRRPVQPATRVRIPRTARSRGTPAGESPGGGLPVAEAAGNDPARDKPTQDGLAQDEPAQDGLAQDEPAQNGLVQDEPAQDKGLPRWSAERANAWYAKQPWLVGCNFIPSTAINQLEMWQADTFDPATIDRELGWAEGLGMNCVRVYLHDLAWHADADGFKKRIGNYLDIAAKHKIRTIFVLFDACWQPEPKVGKQPAPVPGVISARLPIPVRS